MTTSKTKHVRTSVLDMAYEEWGLENGHPLILLHGFPDDAHGWEQVGEALGKKGFRVFAPYVRGFGETRFLNDDTPRSGQLASLVQDVSDLADALGINRFTLVGHDWGARAAQGVAIIQPERVDRLVSYGGYAIVFGTEEGGLPYDLLQTLWYQYLLNTDMGANLLKQDCRGFCRYLWSIWSPNWRFDDETFEKTARSFDNPDFPDIVVNAYRYSNAIKDPRYHQLEQRLAQAPQVEVPTIILRGIADPLDPPDGATDDRRYFTNLLETRILEGAGHFAHREKPEELIKVLLQD